MEGGFENLVIQFRNEAYITKTTQVSSCAFQETKNNICTYHRYRGALQNHTYAVEFINLQNKSFK